MKIYVVSSWRCKYLVLWWVDTLREHGHQVGAFADTANSYVFYSSKIKNSAELNAITFLDNKKTKKAFNEEKKGLDWCDCCLLVLPAGNSAHLEAGYAKGQGKKLIIWQEQYPRGEFDVMYGFADLVTDNDEAIIDFVRKHEKEIDNNNDT